MSMKCFNLMCSLAAYVRVSALFILLLFCRRADAQITAANDLRVYCSNNDSIIAINYRPAGIVYNLLVQISDSGGRTVFLENKHKFSGNYQCIYNANLWKGDFLYVQLIADDKRFNKKIELK